MHHFIEICLHLYHSYRFIIHIIHIIYIVLVLSLSLAVSLCLSHPAPRTPHPAPRIPPLALTHRRYTHLVQLLVDALVLTAPFALAADFGVLATIAGTALLTLFYAGILDLAKVGGPR